MDNDFELFGDNLGQFDDGCDQPDNRLTNMLLVLTIR